MRIKENLQPPLLCPVFWEALYAANYVFHMQEKKLTCCLFKLYVKDFSSYIGDLQHEKQITHGKQMKEVHDWFKGWKGDAILGLGKWTSKSWS